MKKAIIIGASSGIGRELAKILARNEYVVGVMARRVHLLNELRDEAEGAFFVQEIDVMDTGPAGKGARLAPMQAFGGERACRREAP